MIAGNNLVPVVLNKFDQFCLIFEIRYLRKGAQK